MEAMDGVNGTQFQLTPAEVAEMEDILTRHNGSMPTREVHEALAEKFSFERKRNGCVQGEVHEIQIREWFQRKRDALKGEKSKVSSVPSSPTFRLEEQNVDPAMSCATTSASTQPQLLSVLPSETPQVSTLPPTGSETNLLIPTNPRSIRCRESSSTAKRRRGIVNGTRVANNVRTLGGRIKVERAKVHDGPASRQVRSLLVHEIGSCVREKVPLLAPTYSGLDKKQLKIVPDHLIRHFVIESEDLWIRKFITKVASERYKDWKYDCKKHWEKYGDELPKEFVDRPEQWQWLINHFKDLSQQAKCQRMKAARQSSNHINHHSGKVAFSHRADEHLRKGHKAPLIAAFEEVYSADPAGASIAERMKKRVREMLGKQASLDPSVMDDPIPVETQIKIIDELVGSKRGTQVSKVGRCIKKPSRPRGGTKFTTQSSTMKEELLKANEEVVTTDRISSLEERLRVLEELVRSGAWRVR